MVTSCFQEMVQVCFIRIRSVVPPAVKKNPVMEASLTTIKCLEFVRYIRSKKSIIPLCPEPILKEDGSDKNDCERNACKRFLKNFRREHPHLKAIFLADGLSSNAPNIEMLKENNLRFILIAKPGDHRYLFKQLEESEKDVYHEIYTEDGCYHQFRFFNRVSLNKSCEELKVNVLEYR